MRMKFWSVLLSGILMLSILPVGVGASQNITYTIQRNDIDGVVHQNIVISGQIPESANRQVRVLVYEKSSPDHLTDSHIKGIEQTTVNSSGTFSITVTLNKGAQYEFEVLSNEMSAPYRFEIAIKGQAEYDEMINRYVTASDAEKMQQILEETASDFQLNTTYYNTLSETGKRGVAEALLKVKSEITLLNINELYDWILIAASFQYNQSTEVLKNILTVYEGIYFNLKDTNGAANIYKSCFTDYPQLIPGTIEKMKGITYDSPEDLKTRFREAVMIAALNQLDTGKANSFLLNNSDYLGTSTYASLENTAKSKVLNYIRNKASSINSKADFTRVYKDALDALTQQPNSGNGGGGSGGGGTTISVDPNLLEKPKPSPIEEVKSFTDLSSVPWAQEAITYLEKEGVVSGKEPGKFYPEDAVKREEFAKILAGALELNGVDYNMNFSDVSSADWFYSSVSALKKQELVKGISDTHFGIGQNITREDLATILYRSITILSIGKSVGSIDESKRFADYELISDYAKNSVEMLRSMNLISGVGEGLFAPKNNATRAEVSVMIYNIIKLRKGV